MHLTSRQPKSIIRHNYNAIVMFTEMSRVIDHTLWQFMRKIIICATCKCENYAKCENSVKCENSAKCEKSTLKVKKAGSQNVKKYQKAKCEMWVGPLNVKNCLPTLNVKTSVSPY